MSEEKFSDLLKKAASRFSGVFSGGLGVEPHSRFKIYHFLYEETDITNLFYWISLLSSAGIATLGLAQNSPAVIIGAMLLSPLMGPIIAFGLALAIGDLYLGLRAVINCVMSIFIVLMFSALITHILPFQLETVEILSRTRPNTLDLGVALLCGVIGAISVARLPIGGASMALPGVAIAVALIPPLCTAGFGIGAGLKWGIFSGAFLLFLTNLVSIVFASLAVFLLLRMGDEEEIGKIRDFIYERSQRNMVFRWLTARRSLQAFRKVGKLSNRIVILGVALVAVAIPLRLVLNQIKREVVIKKETQKAIARFLPGTTLLSKEIKIDKNETNMHFVIMGGSVSVEESVRKVEEYLGTKLEENVKVSYIEVPNKAAVASASESGHHAVPTVGTVSREMESRFFVEARRLLPAKRRSELLRIGLAVDTDASMPVMELVFLSDDRFTAGESGILESALGRTLSDPVRLNARTIPVTAALMDLSEKEQDPVVIRTLSERLSAFADGMDGLRVIPEIVMPEKLSQLKRAKAIWRSEEILKELRAVYSDLPAGEPAIGIDGLLQSPQLRLRFERINESGQK